MAKYQVANKKLGVHVRINRQKVQVPVLMVCVQCRIINELARNKWQSSKGRAVFLSRSVSPADPYVLVQIVRVAMPVPYGYV
jgi:hypothetical protein